MTDRRRILWTFVVTSVALFMGSLDNLVVTTALPSIRDHLHASLGDLQWTVNAYTLTFAVLLLTGATLGDRFGRRRVFVIGLGVFTAGSAAAALAPGNGLADPRPALPGSRRRHPHPANADPAVGGRTASPARPGARCLGSGGRPGHRHRAARGMRRGRGRLLAVDLLAERADRAGAPPVRLDAADRELRPGDPPGPARRRPGEPGAARD